MNAFNSTFEVLYGPLCRLTDLLATQGWSLNESIAYKLSPAQWGSSNFSQSMLGALFPLFSLFLSATSLSTGNTPVTFEIDASTGNKTSFTIAAFLETNIGRGDDGGIYAELIQNRAFQESDSYLTIPGWVKVGDNVVLLQDPTVPLNALPRSLQIFVPGSTTPGQVAGVNNTGWWGIPILPQTYQASFWAKRDTPLTGNIHLSLASLTNGLTYASTTFPASSLTTSWKQFTTTFKPTGTAPDTNNVLSLTMDVVEKDQFAWFNLISLFPPTWNNRQNGLRSDLANALNDLGTTLIRLPGGSNLQGSDLQTRYNWSNTLGPLIDRPGRQGYWVGYQTEGLGLMELLDMTEDMGATAVLGIYDAYAADDESVPNNFQLNQYVEDAVNELHFILGDASTNSWAKMRADLGHPEPYTLKYVELGNEDWTSTTYNYRWPAFYNALKAAYPDVNYIASASITGVELPAVDVHDYSGPDAFIGAFDRYDNWPRNGTGIWELENGVINTNSSDPFSAPTTRLLTPTLQGSLAESVFIMGMQRNGDLTLGLSYAPYLANIEATQWTPNMIQFNITDLALSTSYYVHQMVSKAHADTILSATSSADLGPLYWVASSINSTTFFLEIANVEDTPFTLSGTIKNAVKAGSPAASSTSHALTASATMLAAGPGQAVDVTNSLATPDSVLPSVSAVKATLQGNEITFEGSIPGWSFQVVRIDL